MIVPFLILILIVNAVGNILLKKGAGKENIYFNALTISGYGVFLFVVLLGRTFMMYYDVRMFSLVIGLNYLVIYLSSIVFLKEKTSLRRIVGIVVVCIGSVVFNLDRFL